MTALSRSIRLPQAIRPRDLPFGRLTPLVLWALVGVELTFAVALWPETVETWLRAEHTGDFRNFLDTARHFEPNGIYGPALTLILHPLSHLDVAVAYQVYVALGLLAYGAVAFLAQRGVQSLEARFAVVLGVLTVPQMHWALRFGHMTPFLALAALAGFLLLRRRPVLAGLCFALLILKPQYAPLPALYMLWSRNWRALGTFAVGAVAIEIAGFAAIGFHEVGPAIAHAFDWGTDPRDNLLPIQQAWQYSWSGFLISLGLDPNPMVTFDLLVLSLVAVVLVWRRNDQPVALAATAIGMLLVTPYSNFYDWGLLAVGAGLLVRAGQRGRSYLSWAAGGLYIALLASQAATPWPIVNLQLNIDGEAGHFFITPEDIPAAARGVYWVTPLALVTVCLLALAPGGAREDAPRRTLLPWTWLLAPAALLVAAGYFATAFMTHTAPFIEDHNPFSRSAVLREVPPDFPLPDDTEVLTAGQGAQLPYHVEWTAPQPVSEVAGIYQRLIASNGWDLMLHEQTAPSYRVRVSRVTPGGFMTHWAMLDVSPWQTGSRISLDFIVTQRISITIDRTPAPE